MEIIENIQIHIKKQNLNNSFNLGKNIEKINIEVNKDIAKLCSGFIDNKLVTVLDDIIYYNGIQVTSENSEIVTNISNLGFSVTNTNGKVLITFNKDKCILSDTEIVGMLEQKASSNDTSSWKRYTQIINGKVHLLEVYN